VNLCAASSSGSASARFAHAGQWAHVVFCRAPCAVCHGDAEPSMVSWMPSSRFAVIDHLFFLYAAVLSCCHLTSNPKSRYLPLHTRSSSLACADASQRPHLHIKLSPLCAKQPPLVDIPCQALGPIISTWGDLSAQFGGGVIMEPSLVNMGRDWMASSVQDACRHSLSSVSVSVSTRWDTSLCFPERSIFPFSFK